MYKRQCLTSEATALAVDEHVILTEGIGQRQGLANDGLQRFIAEVAIEITLIDEDLALAGDQTNAGDRLFSSANGCLLYTPRCV